MKVITVRDAFKTDAYKTHKVYAKTTDGIAFRVLDIKWAGFGYGDGTDFHIRLTGVRDMQRVSHLLELGIDD